MTPLRGHDAAVAAFGAGLESGRLHHAWLLAGPKGIGKALFARSAALRLLVDSAGTAFDGFGFEVDENDQGAKLFKAETHPDYRLVEREVWDSKGNIIPKHERSGSEEPSRSIRIKQIRLLEGLLTVTPSIAARRVIVIDAADDLEPGAANALLKMLEEPPPKTVFLLVSHAPDRLLPTIRSRCRLLRLKPLEDDAMTAALKLALPDAEEDELAALARAGEGAPGRAVAWHGLDVGALDRTMDALVREGDPANSRRAALAQGLALKSAQPRYEAFLARAPSRIAAEARLRRGAALAEALGLWERASELAGSAQRLSLDPQSTVFELAGMLAALAPAGERDAA